MDKQLRDVEERYRTRGLIHGGLLLLKPVDAVAFSREVARLGIVNLGPELWYYKTLASGEQGLFEEIEAPNYSGLSEGTDAVRKTADAAENFLLHHLPAHIALVSFVLAAERDPQHNF